MMNTINSSGTIVNASTHVQAVNVEKHNKYHKIALEEKKLLWNLLFLLVIFVNFFQLIRCTVILSVKNANLVQANVLLAIPVIILHAIRAETIIILNT